MRTNTPLKTLVSTALNKILRNQPLSYHEYEAILIIERAKLSAISFIFDDEIIKVIVKIKQKIAENGGACISALKRLMTIFEKIITGLNAEAKQNPV